MHVVYIVQNKNFSYRGSRDLRTLPAWTILLFALKLLDYIIISISPGAEMLSRFGEHDRALDKTSEKATEPAARHFHALLSGCQSFRSSEN